MTTLDWVIIALYFVFAAAIGLALSNRAGRSLSDYFVGGRSLPWWLAGTSMVATTFAADTPLAVTEMVAKHGVAGNWLWWNMVMSGILTVFFYARLWRRAGVITDVEFTELRYGGKPAALLRGFRAAYLALPINLIIMGWVNLAMMEIVSTTLGISQVAALLVCFLLAAAYSVMAGLWGVVVTDFFQFGLAVGGAVILAIFAVHAVGGIEGMQMGLEGVYGSSDAALAMLPRESAAWMPAITMAVYLGVNWWASWYPGAEPGGGGYIAQRIFSARTRARRRARHALVQHRPLRRAALAVDPGGAGLHHPLSRASTTRARATSWRSWTSSRPGSRGWSSPASPPPTCPPSPPSSTGARATWSTTCTRASCAPTLEDRDSCGSRGWPRCS